MPLRVVTLDAGGTLIAVAEPVGETYARIAARHGLRVDADAVERAFRAAFAAAPPLAFAGGSPVRLPDHERAWWYAVVRRAFGARAEGAAFDAAFAELFAYYAAAAAWRVFPEVPDVLTALRARGLRLAAVSNFDARLGPLLDALGIGVLLDAVVPSSRAGSAKPDPGIFRVALGRLGLAPADAVHVGDDPNTDVAGACAAGMAAVLVARDGNVPELPPGVAVVTSLRELPALLASLLASA